MHTRPVTASLLMSSFSASPVSGEVLGTRDATAARTCHEPRNIRASDRNIPCKISVQYDSSRAKRFCQIQGSDDMSSH